MPTTELASQAREMPTCRTRLNAKVLIVALGLTVLLSALIGSATAAPTTAIDTEELTPNSAANATEPTQIATGTATVTINNFAFVPATMQVTAGSTVTWINHDDMPHNVVSSAQPRAFSSPPLDTDEHFSYRFTKTGIYTYFCSLHPRMTGTIIVK